MATTTHEERSTGSDNVKEQDATSMVHSKESIGHSGSLALPGDRSGYPPNIYAPQAQPFYYRGYGNAGGEWGEYPQYVSPDELEMGSPGVFHTGYGYGPQMPYGPYSPVTTPLPSVGSDAQLYSSQQFAFSGPPYYQQLSPAGVPYISSPTPVSQPAVNALASIDQHGNNILYGPRPSDPLMGSFDRGSYPGNTGNLSYDLQQGFDGSRSGGLWSDWSKTSGRHSPLIPLSPAVSPQPVVTFGSFGHNSGMASQQQRSLYGLGSGSNTYGRGYSGFDQGSSFGSASISSVGMNSRGWVSLENARQRRRSSIPLCGCNGTSLDILSEQNRGPRASKPKSQDTTDLGSVESNKPSKPTLKIHNEAFNKPDFVTEYKDAKFFIIKSYSEDNVHKSIKYGVWASTPNGNRKLDNAYREAIEKLGPCPVFLFFSVNASGQFCGVAEMIGPVDFDKSVNYWQQDKWSGQFPVKWHIIKDVPNSQLRHIVLENNDNKPVTNSRDTQEVKLEQGIEMLNIFKNYETEMSILDDFEFYEDRQKAMQEKKARQHASLMSVGVVGETEHENHVTLPSNFIKQMSKSFAQAVLLDESGKEATITDKASSVSGGNILAVSSAEAS